MNSFAEMNMLQIAQALTGIVVSATLAMSGCRQSPATARPPSQTMYRTSATTLPVVGELVAGTGAVRNKSTLLIVMANALPMYELSYLGNAFVLGVDNHGVIRCVSTQDSRFTTPDGVRIGDSEPKVARATGLMPVKLPDLGYVVVLPSGWIAMFSETLQIVDGEVSTHGRVVCLARQNIDYLLKSAPASTEPAAR